MNYICIFEYSGKAINCKHVTIPYGAEMTDNGNYIFDADKNPICRIDSQVGHMYFANNDDGNGLERGAIIRKLTIDCKYSDEQVNIIFDNYSDFLQSTEFLLFNNDFYRADIDTLRTLIHDLGIEYEVPEVPVAEELEPVQFTVKPLKSAAAALVHVDSDTNTATVELQTNSDISTEVVLQQISDTLDTIIANCEVS